MLTWLYSQKLKSSDARARKAAVERLAADGPRSVSRLVPLVNDPDAGVRLAVVTALARVPHPACVEALTAALADDDDAVRRSARQALTHLDEPAYEGVLATHRNAIVESLLAAPDETLVELVGRIGGDDTVEPLVLRLERAEATERATAARALGVLTEHVSDDARALIVNALRPLLGDADQEVQLSAAFALATRADDSRARNVLLEFAHAPTAAAEGVLSGDKAEVPARVRLEAIRSLGRLNDPATRAVLLAILRDLDPDVRSAACEALGMGGDARAIDVLRKVQMNDSDPAVKEKAKFAIMDIRERHAD